MTSHFWEVGLLGRLVFRDDDLHLLKKIIWAPAVLSTVLRDRLFSERDYLSACAIFKNEARFVPDWVSFHHALGVDRFYLYDNDSTDRPRESLAAWIERGVVSIFEWPGAKRQISAYLDCVRRFRDVTRWIMFADIDEFFFPTKAPSLPAVLRNLERFSGVYVPEHIYGSSGHVRPSRDHPGRAFLMRADDNFPRLGKSFVNPRRVRRIENPHVFQYWFGTTVLTDGRPLRRCGPIRPTSPDLRLNHYWSRSIEDLLAKHGKGDARYGDRPSLASMLEREQMLNAVLDDAILPVLSRIEGQSN